MHGRSAPTSRTLRARALVALLVAAPLGAPAAASRVEAAPAIDASVKARAAKAFRAAEAAFRRGEYRRAAEGFEDAYATAPHPFALWNAVLAWSRAGERVRAANRCEAFLREATADDKNRADAEQLLARLEPTLARLDVAAPGGRELALDGAPIEPGRRFVEPGDHVVGARFDDGALSRTVDVAAGATLRVALAPRAAREASPPVVAAAEPAPAASRAADKPLAKGWFFVGLGLTAALGAATIASGVDTNAAATAFHDHPTTAGLDDGRGRQTRTNALLVATGASALASAALGVFAVRWSSPAQSAAEVSLRVGVAGVSVGGGF